MIKSKRLKARTPSSPSRTADAQTYPGLSPGRRRHSRSPEPRTPSATLKSNRARRQFAFTSPRSSPDVGTRKTPELGAMLSKDADRSAQGFISYVVSKGIEGLKKEFVELHQEKPQEFEIRAFNSNMDKNRYRDVTCLDATRTVLRLNVPPDTCYIHANRVEMTDVDKVFIATQAPTEDTFGDFWRLCFQESVSTIVMLCSFKDSRGRASCLPYFPLEKDTTETYSCITVKCLNTEIVDTVMMYDLEMFYPNASPDECRKQVRLHRMEDWPDRGVPKSGRSIINILRAIDKARPCVIHCSAGIGRTGAAIAIETGIQRFTKGKPADVMAIVEELRCKRAHSVQTELQYVFIYFALLEYIKHKLPKYASRMASFRRAFKREVEQLEDD